MFSIKAFIESSKIGIPQNISKSKVKSEKGKFSRTKVDGDYFFSRIQGRCEGSSCFEGQCIDGELGISLTAKLRAS